MGTAAIGILAAFVYVVVVGGTGSGELQPVLRTLNSLLGGVLIAAYVIRAPTRADAIDHAVLVAILLFSAAGVLSAFPRQSLDAVLAAMTYAGAFFLARELLSNGPARIAFIRILIGLSAIFTIGAALLWIPSVVEWWALTNRTVMPPLDIQLSGGPWGHRYDVALLIALIYPAWWVGRPSLGRRVAAVTVGMVGLSVIAITGSRTLWASLAIATATLAIPGLVRLWRAKHRRLPMTIGAIFALAVIAASGLATSIIERGASLASLDFRLSMWGPLTDVWLSHPVAGVGPGSFPWALQLTTYYDTNSWAPRHPDSLLFQLLPEAGALGVAAVGTLAVFVVPRVIRTSGAAARWALVAFAIACLGANPTDFAFLIVVALGWAAYAAPRDPLAKGTAGPPRGRGVTYAALGSLAIVFLAGAATLVGGFAHESARLAIERGDLDRARTELDLAVTVDPGMALYVRQRGALRHIQGDEALAIDDLERAVALNPSDDLAARTLFLAYERASEAAAARGALARALQIQRSDPVNLLLAAQLATAEGEAADAVDLLAEVVQSWPTIVASPGWAELLPASASTADIVDVAAARWQAGAPTPEPPFDQGIWLARMSDDTNFLRAEIASSPMGEDLAQVMAQLIACDTTGGAVLDALPQSAHRSYLYWNMRVRLTALEGNVDLGALQALQIMTGGPHAPATADLRANPLDENAGYSLDRWGYRRNAVDWPIEGASSLPSIYAGASLWLFDPRAAVEAADLGARFDQC